MDAQRLETKPKNIDPREFRNTMGRFATGVTIITTEHNGSIHGMTANAFLSVSLEPPLVLISIDNRAKLHQMLPNCGRYGVSFLAAGQEALSNHFAGRSQEGLEIPFVEHHGMPVIEGAVGHIVTRIVETVPVGDHTLYVGQVEYLAWCDDEPLLFYAGKYGDIQAR